MPEQPSTQEPDISSQFQRFLKSRETAEKFRTTPERTIRSLVRIADGGGNLSSRDTDRIESQARPQIIKIIVAQLSDNGSPVSIRDYRDWQARAAVLHALDTAEYARLQNAILTNLRAALARTDIEWPDANNIQTFRNRGEAVHRLLTMQRSSQGVTLCLDKIAELERSIQRIHGDNLVRIVAGFSNATQEFMQKLEKAGRPVFREEIIALARIQRLPLVEQSYGWHYENPERNGTKTNWLIQGAHDSADIVVFRNTNNRSMMVALTKRELLEALEQSRLPDLVERARKNYREENDEENVKVIESFDLPRNEPVAYVRLFPRTFDNQTIDKGLLTANLMSIAMQRQYPNLRSLPILFSDTPKKDLIETIRNQRQQASPPRHFFIDVYSHGSRESLDFEQQLTAADIADIVRQFPECHFTMNTVACFGGGLNEGIQKEIKTDPALRRRLTVFLQTRGNVVNLASFRGEMASDYNVYLIQALLDPNVRTYGMAARRADVEVKRYMPTDAEAIIQGIHIGRNDLQQTKQA